MCFQRDGHICQLWLCLHCLLRSVHTYQILARLLLHFMGRIKLSIKQAYSVETHLSVCHKHNAYSRNKKWAVKWNSIKRAKRRYV